MKVVFSVDSSKGCIYRDIEWELSVTGDVSTLTALSLPEISAIPQVSINDVKMEKSTGEGERRMVRKYWQPMKEDDIFTGKINPRLILVSGESDSGKTTWCSDKAEKVRERGFTVGGLLSPGVYRRGSKVGIELLNLVTEEKRILGELRPEEIPGAPTQKWAMNFKTLDWGNQVLRRMDYYDMIVIDELGPLEFLHQQGLLEAFDLIGRQRFKTALIVVRPNLLAAAKEIWSDLDVIVRILAG